MAKSATKDMTVGSPMKLILSFSMPLLIGFILTPGKKKEEKANES